MQQLVQAIGKHVGELSGPLADIHPLTAPNWYGMTPVGSPLRRTPEGNVGGALAAACGRCAQITDATVSIGNWGLGGVGKSLLAEEYALHFGAAYPDGVFWLRAYGNDDAKAAFGQRSARRCVPTRCARSPSVLASTCTVSPRTNRGRAGSQDRERRQTLPLGRG